VGVSKQIRDKEFKSSVKTMLYSILQPEVGVIVRTAALEATPAIIKREYYELLKIWNRISANVDKAVSPALLYKEVTVSKKLIRDLMKRGVEHIYVDSKEIYHDILEYFSYLGINMKKKVHLYQFKIPILAYYEIDRELEKMFKPEVYLKGGASIVIETTEALTAIDVNSGKISRSRDDDALIKDINIMAAEEIARQLRLRDLGGIIVIDFIDMSDEISKKELLMHLKKYLKNDRSTTKTLKVSQFGLVEMTRKKIGPSVINYFIDKCDCCEGRGYTPKPFYIGLKLVRWLKENGKNYSEDTLIVNAQENVVNSIKKNLMRYIETVMKDSRMNVKIQISDTVKNGVCEIYSVNKVERIATVN
jgi:Rne/Rng family ribonuclease